MENLVDIVEIYPAVISKPCLGIGCSVARNIVLGDPTGNFIKLLGTDSWVIEVGGHPPNVNNQVLDCLIIRY
jgi:hypothetical protein